MTRNADTAKGGQPGEAEDGDRYQAGWRSGKPVEDPEKLKRWGFVTAKPSEYLICIRNGNVDRKRSGQGARIFKWPWEAIAIVPTTLQQIEFTADQITRECIGVQVTGIAVYRIAEPELAYRVLNFTYSERASQKLGATLREMFIGASRRLIANLSLDECLTKRKEAIAAFLMQEIDPVVRGKGAPEDATDRGWGVVLDTIEVQDVHIQSQEVFAHLQAPYRAEIAMRAEMAELERQRVVAERRAETERQTAEASLKGQRETRILRARAEAEAAETEAAQSLRAEQARARAAAEELDGNVAIERRKEQIAQEQELLRIRAAEEKRRAVAAAEVQALAAETEVLETQALAVTQRLERERQQKLFTLQTELSLRDQQVRMDLEVRRKEVEVRQVEAQMEGEQQRALAEIEQMLNQGRALRELVTTGLPQIASCFKQSFGTIHYTHLGGGGESGDNPLSLVSSALMQVLTVAKSFGLDPAILSKPPSEKP